MERAAEDDVERRGVDDKHAEASTTEDTGKVPWVADDALAEGVGEACLDGEDLWMKAIEYDRGDYEGMLTLKHCVMKTER
jgi:hypothetical protein